MPFLQKNIVQITDTIGLQLVNTQIDTIPLPNQQDSVEALSLGVDPIFIMNERKTKEVIEYKEKQIIAQQRKRQKPKPRVDTTCLICPKGEPASFHEILADFETNTTPFFVDNFWLYNNSHEHLERNQIIFIESKPANEKPLTIIEKKREIETSHIESWFFVIILLMFIIITTLRIYFKKYLSGLFQGFLSFYSASKVYREGSLTGRRVDFILDINFFVISSLFAVYIIKYLNFPLQQNIPIWVLALIIFGALIAFTLIKRIILYIVSTLSQTKQELHEIVFNQNIYTRILGLILVPLTFLIIYSQAAIADVTLYIMLSTMFISMIMRAIRTFQLFISKGFSIFYFLLYLCALEITPVLVVFKEVMLL